MADFENLDSLFSTPQQPEPPKPKKQRLPGLYAILSALGVCVLIGLAVWGAQKAPEDSPSVPTESTAPSTQPDTASQPDQPETAPRYGFLLDSTLWGDDDSLVGKKYNFYATIQRERLELLDERAMITRLVGMNGSSKYLVTGCLTEPTRLVVTFEDWRTGEVLERVTVLITYDRYIQEYNLTLVDSIHTTELVPYP